MNRLSSFSIKRAAEESRARAPVGSLFASAATWEARRAYEIAFEACHQANAFIKRQLSYHPRRHRAEVEAAIARFSWSFMKAREGWGNASRIPVFVVGMPHSGTELVASLLDAHSAITSLGETDQIPEQIADLEPRDRKLGSALAYPACVAELTHDDCDAIARHLVAGLTRLAPGARYVVDALPSNVDHIGLIKMLLPNAVILHCQRDPRDIAVSIYTSDDEGKFGRMAFGCDLAWIGEQLVDHDRLMSHWHEVFPGQIVEVLYEDLIEKPETCTRRMIAHLQLPWEPGLLDACALLPINKGGAAGAAAGRAMSAAPGRWKHYKTYLGPLEEAMAWVPPMPQPMPTAPSGMHR